MNLNINNWKSFLLADYFDIVPGKYHYQDEYESGDTPYVSASNTNNGVGSYINLPPDFEGNCIITGKIGCTAFYQSQPFCATSDVNVFIPKFEMNDMIATFIVAVINFDENYRWNYGRQCRVGDSKKISIKLPADANNEPDWKIMESYMRSLHSKPISTTINDNRKRIDLNTKDWKEFYLHRIFYTEMGNGIDAVTTTSDNPKYNYVSRDSNGNGVVAFIDEIEGESPFPAGAMSLALGGSFLGSCFIQKYPFYTAQNVAVLREKCELSNYTKLFLTTIIRNECKIKYQAFGRELNAHFRKDFTIKLPVKKENNVMFIDNNKEFSDEGYVPDWEWMENYIKSLPYSDRII